MIEFESSFGAWYVKTPVLGQVVEFKFDHDPSEQEISDAATAYEAAMQSAIEIEAEDGEIL